MSQRAFNFLVGFLVVLIVASVIAAVFFSPKSRAAIEFEAACQKVGGIPAWDRKQWQCLK